MPRIILGQYTSTPRYTQYHVSPKTSSPTPVSTLTHKPSPFFLIGKVKTEQRTGQRNAFDNKDACRGRPEGLRYFGCAFSDIHVEARQRDGDMQGGDTLACACLLDLPPLPRGMEFRCFLAGIYARVNPKATSRDRSGRGRCVSGVVFI